MTDDKKLVSHSDAFPLNGFERICSVIRNARLDTVHLINQTMVQAYWTIGHLIVENIEERQVGSGYGKKQIENLSHSLTREFGKGFDERNLRNMRRFYVVFPNWNAVRTELSWTHYRILIRIKDPKAREWYLLESIEQNWSTRMLDRQVQVLYYERLLSSQNKEVVKQEAVYVAKEGPKVRSFLRDPYVLDFLQLPSERLLERDLEQGLIDNLQKFLLELGKGFAFVARQQRVSTEDQDYYIDLVFYHYKLNCFLLIDLKLGKLTHQDVGQMDSYVRIYDEKHRAEGDQPTIGLILCSQKSEAVVKYSVLTDSEQLFSAKYMPYLPTESELRAELIRERQMIQEQQATYGRMEKE